MSDSEHQEGAKGPGPGSAQSGVEPGTPEPAKLRRGAFGYKRADVDRALEERDAQVTELRQDIAALWLAFAQHDRMIRTALGEAAAPPPAPVADDPEDVSPPPEEERAEEASTKAIGTQLSDLDEVLAAIETATQTLERTYADEVATSSEAEGAEDDDDDPPATDDDDERAN